jgi:hypothetical protein
MIRFSLFAACLLLFPAAVTADSELPALSLGGLLFGDFYTVPSHHLPDGDGAVGLVIRRGYITVDADFTDNWFGRMRFELNQSGEFETYTYTFRFKDLYTGWNLGRQKLIVGLSPTPTFDLIESIWGLRYLVRTPMDLQGVASRDTGINLKGPLNASGSISYRTMVTAAVEFGNDSDDASKWMGALAWNPAPNWTIDLYLEKEWGESPANRSTYQIFTGYKSDSLAWGIQYSNEDRQEDPPLELASAFARKRVGDKFQLIGRVDRLLEPSPRGNGIAYLPFDPTAKATMWVGAVEFQATPHFAITPNVILTHYDRNDEGIRPKKDLYLRLTLFINFE